MPELDQRTTLLYRPVNDVGGGSTTATRTCVAWCVAAEFGEWGLVQRLARELEARRLARGGES